MADQSNDPLALWQKMIGERRLPPVSFEDLPISRLSKRMTRKPRAASWRQKSSSQRIIWDPNPMINSNGSAAASPKIS